MRKILLINFLVLLSFSSLVANEKLESTSFSVTELHNHSKGNAIESLRNDFLLTNKTDKDIPTVMLLKRISMTEGHCAEFCFGESCQTYDGKKDELETSSFSFKAGATTDPEWESHIDMEPNEVEGKDTLLVTIYNKDDKENDFVQFKMTWDFSDGSIAILNDHIEIYPNPVKNVLHINANCAKVDYVEFFDVNGKFIHKAEIAGQNNEFIVNIEILPVGTYFGYLIKDGKKVNSFKIVK